MNESRDPDRSRGRGGAFLRFLLGVIWFAVAYFLSDKAAHGFTHGEFLPLIRDLFQIFLLIVGYSYMELAWSRSRDPLRDIGLAARPGASREFGLGAALGWGMAAVTILAVGLFGHFYILLRGSGRNWGMLLLQLLTLAAASLAAELAFRGYPFQKLVQSTGPITATVLAGIFFAFLRLETPGATTTALWISGVAAVLLSAAYLRTHALWICWGLHFAWLASIALLFGQPLAGVRATSSVVQTYADGPTWLTGSEFGPEGSVVALIVLWIGLFVLFRITRDLAWKFAQPDLKPAGIPMELGHSVPTATPPPPPAPLATSAAGGLVQIASADLSTPQNANSHASEPGKDAPETDEFDARGTG